MHCFGARGIPEMVSLQLLRCLVRLKSLGHLHGQTLFLFDIGTDSASFWLVYIWFWLSSSALKMYPHGPTKMLPFTTMGSDCCGADFDTTECSFIGFIYKFPLYLSVWIFLPGEMVWRMSAVDSTLLSFSFPCYDTPHWYELGHQSRRTWVFGARRGSLHEDQLRSNGTVKSFPGGAQVRCLSFPILQIVAIS